MYAELWNGEQDYSSHIQVLHLWNSLSYKGQLPQVLILPG